jgi:hypothetical protein
MPTAPISMLTVPLTLRFCATVSWSLPDAPLPESLNAAVEPSWSVRLLLNWSVPTTPVEPGAMRDPLAAVMSPATVPTPAAPPPSIPPPLSVSAPPAGVSVPRGAMDSAGAPPVNAVAPTLIALP